MITNADEERLGPEAWELFRWDMSSRWRCVCCGDVVYLKTAAVIGMYCCGGCGWSTYRPWRRELPALAPGGPTT